MSPFLELVGIQEQESFKIWTHGYPYVTVRWHFHPEYELNLITETSGRYFIGDHTTVNRADIQLDDVVVIAGAGPLGLGMVQIAHLKTPKKLVVIDLVPQRLALARGFGADVTIDPTTDNARAVIDQLTGGYDCDVYIETTGVPAGVTQGLELIRKLGRFVEFSVFGKDTTADWSIIGDRKELDVRGSHLGPYCYPIVIDLMERGLLTSRGIVTHDFPLSQWEHAFALANSLDSIKVLLKPDRR